MVFKYKAYKELLQELGRNDYVVEISELAVQDFLQGVSKAADPKEFVKARCEEHGIMVSYDNANTYYNQVTLAHIANVYHLAETFFYDLQNEYNELTGSKWSFDSGKTKRAQVISFFSAKGRFNKLDCIPGYLVDSFDYYHQLRVYFSHKKTTSINEIKNKWEKAQNHFDVSLFSKYKIKQGPKFLDKIDFADYFLFTQISKELALKISSICYPDPEGFAKLPEIKKLKKYRKTFELETRIESYLKTHYGFVKENDSDNLVEEISKQL